MKRIELSPLPNQEISVNLGGKIWQIRLTDCGIMAVDITISGEPIVMGLRIVAGTPILPYRRFWAEFGGLSLAAENSDEPDWRKFGTSQWLFWLSPVEVGLESA